MNKFLHVGFPKAASTTLQKQVFERHPQIANLGKPNLQHKTKASAFMQQVRHTDSLNYDRGKAHELWAEICDANAEASAAILSHEMFAGAMAADRSLIAERLYDICAPCRVLVVLRGQPGLLISLYRDLRASGRAAGSFSHWLQEQARNRTRGYFHILRYADFLQLYADLFGKQNIGVFLYESLERNPQQFATEIANFLQVDPFTLGSAENVAVSSRRMAYVSLRKYILPGVKLRALMPLGWKRRLNAILDRGGRKEFSIDTRSHELIYNAFAGQNATVANVYGLGLHEYDYPI